MFIQWQFTNKVLLVKVHDAISNHKLIMIDYNIKCIEDGEVSLYHDGTQKRLDTTATGIDVNGTVTANRI